MPNPNANLVDQPSALKTAAHPPAWPFYALLAALLLTPLPFGSMFQWSLGSLAVIVGVLLLHSGIRVLLRRNDAPAGLNTVWIPASLYLLVVIWVAIQGSGLPPSSWDHPLWKQAADSLGLDIPGSPSLNPFVTQSEVLKLLTYAGTFWLAMEHGRMRERAWTALWIFAIASALYAIYGISAELTELGDTLWLHEMPHESGITSTFANRSMYAVYAGFGLLAILGLILNMLTRRSARAQNEPLPAPGLSPEVRNKILPLAAVAIVVLTALIMTAARSAVFASLVASFILAITLASRARLIPRVRRRLYATALCGLVLWLLLFALTGAYLGSRLAGDVSGGWTGRLAGYEMTLSAIAQAPLTGFGAGNFRDVFYLHNDGTLWKTFNYAHNLYLGAAVEMGVPAATTLIIAIAMIAWSCFRGIERRRRDHALPALGVAITSLIGVHGLTDSPLYLPANAATFSFLLGLAYAQSWPSQARVPSRPIEEPPYQAPTKPPEPVEAQSE